MYVIFSGSSVVETHFEATETQFLKAFRSLKNCID